MSELSDNIIRLYSGGLSYRQIESELGCSKSTIAYYLGEGQKAKTLVRNRLTRTRRGSQVLKQYSKHHITEDAFLEMYEKFDGKCWSCKESKIYCIDHDHNCCSGVYSCGRCVRGLLCRGCNTGLGHFKDNVDRLAAAMIYLNSSGGGSTPQTCSLGVESV